MEKALLSKEEVAALESVLELNGGDRSGVSQWHGQNLWEGDRAPLNDLDLETINVALYVGYEVELDPGEKVLEFYKESKAVYQSFAAKQIDREFHAGKMDGIRTALEIFNISVSGIN